MVICNVTQLEETPLVINERRQKLWTLLTRGLKAYEIAKELNTDNSTISRDIKYLTVDRLDNISSANGNSNYDDNDIYKIDKYDDQYYLDIGSTPNRFLYYMHVRAEKWKELEQQGHHKPSDYDTTVTMDELDYALKRELRTTPEQRYQQEKKDILFHELYYLASVE